MFDCMTQPQSDRNLHLTGKDPLKLWSVWSRRGMWVLHTKQNIFWISNCSLQPTETILGTSSLKTAANYSLCFVSFLILDRSIRCVTFQITTFCTPNFMSEDQILPQAPLPFQVPSSSVDPVNVMSTPNQSSSSVPVACLGWHPVKIPGYLRDYLLT